MTKTSPKKPSKAAYGASLVVLSSLFYGSYGIWAKLMGNTFGVYMQAGLRSLLVLVFILPLALHYKQWAKVHWRRDFWWLFGLVASSLFIGAGYYYAILRIGIGLATAVNYAAIVIGMFFFGWLFNGERYTKDKFISTVLGVVGLWMVFSPSVHSAAILGFVLACVAGFASGLDVAITQKIRYNATQSTILAWGGGLLVNLPIALVLGEKTPRIGWDVHWLYLVIFSVVSLVSSWLVIRGSKLISAGAVGILGLLEIVFGLVFGVVFFHERPSIMAYVGIAIITAAAAIPYVQHLKVKDEPFDLEAPKS